MALSNEEECQQFRQFIKYRGEMMENNLNFWLEVQKYKVCLYTTKLDLDNSKLKVDNCW